MSTDILNSVSNVKIDEKGKFKYILIKVSSNSGQKFIVRGYADCAYHGDIYERFEEEVKGLRKEVKSECVGGGRILRNGDKIDVFGYSQGYGLADHSKTVEILKKEFPNITQINWSNEGY